jgi:hypothetical protein
MNDACLCLCKCNAIMELNTWGVTAWSWLDVEPCSQPYPGTVAPAARNDGSALIHDLYRFASADRSVSTRSGVEILEANLRNEIVIVIGNDGLWQLAVWWRIVRNGKVRGRGAGTLSSSMERICDAFGRCWPDPLPLRSPLNTMKAIHNY